MMNFGNHVIRQFPWASWKEMQVTKKLVTQFEDNDTVYTIYGYDGPEVLICTIYKGTVPDGILNSGLTQEQNDLDRTEFETDYRPTANAPIVPRTADGRMDVHHTVITRLQNLNVRVFSFYTARPESLHNIDSFNGQDLRDVTYVMYDEGNKVVVDPALAVKTVVDFEPRYDYEIVGGFADLPRALKDGVTDQWYIAAIGVPDLPPEMYGSISYISEVNIEAVQTSRIVTDGRSTSFLPYKFAGYPTNKLRFYVKHPLGAQQRFQIYLELFT